MTTTTGEEIKVIRHEDDDGTTTTTVNTNTTTTSTTVPTYPTTNKCCLPTIVLGSSSSNSTRRNRYKINIQDTIEKFQSFVTITDKNMNTIDTEMVVVNSSCNTTTNILNERQTILKEHEHERQQQQQQQDNEYDTNKLPNIYTNYNNNEDYFDDVYDLITRVYKTKYVPKCALKNDYYGYRKLYIEPTIPLSVSLSSLSLSLSNKTNTTTNLNNLLTRKWKEYFHTWNDTNRKTHLLQWTCIYVCPISGELFFSGKWGCTNSTTTTSTSNTNSTNSATGNTAESETTISTTIAATTATTATTTSLATTTKYTPETKAIALPPITTTTATTTTTTTNSSSITPADSDSTMEVNMIVVDNLPSLQNNSIVDTTSAGCIAIEESFCSRNDRNTVVEETKIMEDDTKSRTTNGTNYSMPIDIDNSYSPSKPKRKVNEEKVIVDYYQQDDNDDEETVRSKEQQQQHQRDYESSSSNYFKEKRKLKQQQKEANKLLPQQQPLSGTQSTYSCYNYITEMKQQEQEIEQQQQQQQQHPESTNSNTNSSSNSNNTSNTTETITIIEKSPLCWFARKGYAEDGAAAICFDCKVYRERQLIIDEQTNNSNNGNDDELILQNTSGSSTTKKKKQQPKQHRPIPQVAKIGLEIPYLEINGYMSIPYHYQQYVPKHIQLSIQQQQTDIFINQRIQRQINTS